MRGAPDTTGRPRPPRALGLLPAAAALLASCGVPPTDVIRSGPAATGLRPETLVYFLSGYDGRLVATPRRTHRPADLPTALGLLFEGPTEQESEGLVTRLSGLPVPSALADGPAHIRLTFPAGVGPLPEPALGQLVCTAAAAHRAPRPGATASAAESASRTPAGREPGRTSVTVLVRGVDWQVSRDADQCPDP